MHEVSLHWEAPALDFMLARRMEMKLKKLVGLAPAAKEAARGHINLDRVAVVHHAGLARPPFDIDGRQTGGRGFFNVDGRLPRAD
ncbi:hypothetical protein GCM10023174_17930 [Chelativorans composti]